MRKKTIIIIVFLLLILAGSVFLLKKQYDKPFTWQFNLPEGTQYVYHVVLQSEDLVSVNKGSMLSAGGWQTLDSSIDFEGDLVITSHKRMKGSTTFLLTSEFKNITRHNFSFNGADVMQSKKEVQKLLDSYAVVSMRNDGRVLKVMFESDAPTVFKTFMKTVVGELQTIIATKGKKSWKVDERNRRGVAVSDYTYESLLFSGDIKLHRSRSQYKKIDLVKSNVKESKVQGTADLLLDTDGHLVSLKGDEKIDVTSSSNKPLYNMNLNYTFKLSAINTVEAKDSSSLVDASLEQYGLRDVVRDRTVEQMNLQKIAKGMTSQELKKLVDDVNSYKIDKEKAIGQIIWRAHGMLGLHPEVAEQFIELFEKETMKSHTKKIMFTMLASQSHPKVQKVVRDLLNKDSVRKDSGYTHMLQEAGFIDNPEKETVDLIKDRMNDPQNKDEKFAAAYTLGTMTRTLEQNGRELEARSYNNEIISQLRSAQTRDEKSGMLMALANTAQEENVAVIGEYAQDRDPEVRNSSALALRKTQTPESERILNELAEDDNKIVRSSALLTMSKYSLEESDLQNLKQKVENGSLTEDNYPMLLQVIASNFKTYPELCKEICRAALDRGIKNKHLAQQFRAILMK